MIKRLEHHSYVERLRNLGLLSLKKRRLNVYKCLKGRIKEDGAGLFSVVFSDWTSSEGHNLKHRQFHLNIRKLFSVTVIEYWHRLPREAVQFPSLVIFKNCPDMVLGNQLCTWLYQGRGSWTKIPTEVSCPTPTFGDSEIL